MHGTVTALKMLILSTRMSRKSLGFLKETLLNTKLDVKDQKREASGAGGEEEFGSSSEDSDDDFVPGTT